MAILAFPSSAIVGNLNWTGTSSSLAATDMFSVSVNDGTTAHTLTMEAGSYLGLYSNSEIVINTAGPLGLSGTGGVNIDGGNQPVNVTSQFQVNQTGELPGESFNLSFTPTGSSISLGELSSLVIQTNNLVSQLSVSDNNIFIGAGDQSASISVNSSGSIDTIGTDFTFNQKKVATQPFSVAMALALG